VIDPRNAWLMDSMLQDVVRRGTARRALSLNRSDLAGKTGTTNEYVDAWFSGYNPDVVAISWLGYDQPRNLGRGETGGSAALPMWINYMRTALKDVPQRTRERPDGLVPLMLADGGQGDFVYRENVPPEPALVPVLPPDLTPPAEAPEEALPVIPPVARPMPVVPAPVIERSLGAARP
jgi:penicillin-binding protein 1A